jgi:hypothetical protein
MKKAIHQSLLVSGFIALISLGSDRHAFANWSTNPQVNDLVTTFSNNQNQLRAMSDGAGGVYIVWKDDRNSAVTGFDIYAQRLSHNGEQMWDENGIVICNAPGAQSLPFLESDRSGGLLIFWTDFRSGNLDIYAQRVNASGSILWSENGIPVADGVGAQKFTGFHHYRNFPPIVPDNAGGAYFAFMSDADGDFDIYAQKINGSGVRQWGEGGVQVTNLSREDRDQRICSDGQGGIIVAWENDKGFGVTALMAQRVGPTGSILWAPQDGINIVPSPAHPAKPGDPEIVPDGLGGAIVLFNTYPGVSTGNLYMQRIDGSGDILWGNSGKVLSNYDQTEILYSIISKGSGEFYVIWADQRAAWWDGPTFNTGTNYDIYAQKIDLDGNRLWTPESGVAVCVHDGVQYSPEAITDPSGSLIVGWRDDRNKAIIGSTGRDIYAQKVNPDGTLGWILGGESGGTLSGDESGVPICSAINDQWEPQLALSSAIGFIITWYDTRNGNEDIFSSFVNYSSGQLGGENVVLPVRWLSTEATQAAENVIVRWSTAWEKDNLEFELYHSADGSDFTFVGTVPGRGQGEYKGISNYQYTHSAPVAGINYYRLRQIDVDGEEEFSPVFSARHRIMVNFELFPNPTSDRLSLRSDIQIGDVKIFNTQGVLLYQQSFGETGQVDLDLSFLNSGQYLVEMRSGYEVRQKSFVKK